MKRPVALGILLFGLLCQGPGIPSAKGQEGADTDSLLNKLRSGTVLRSDLWPAWEELQKAMRAEPDRDWFQEQTRVISAFNSYGEPETALEVAVQAFLAESERYQTERTVQRLSRLYSYGEQVADIALMSANPGAAAEVLDILIEDLTDHVASTSDVDINSRRLLAAIATRNDVIFNEKNETRLVEEIQRVRLEFDENPSNRFAVLAYVEALKSLAVPPGGDSQIDLDAVDELFGFARGLKDHPDIQKVVWGMEFYQMALFLIERLSSEKPMVAKRIAEDAIKALRDAGDGDTAFEQMFEFRVAELERMLEETEAKVKYASIVGRRAPELEAEAWINGDAVSLDELAGQVVLIEFTAVWCGPCIKQHPTLKSLHKDFADDGLVIILATSKYDYQWSEEDDGPVPADGKVDLAGQQELLGRFVEKHDLPFRMMVTDAESTFGDALGVSAIPHCVLIDKRGVVSMICSGNTRRNVVAIRQRVQSLLSQ